MLPRGPRFGLLTLAGYLRDPYGSTLRGFARYGDPVTVRPLGGAVVMTAQSRLIKELLSMDPELFDPFAVAELQPIIGSESLMMLGGERHRSARKLLTPPFHGARMRAYAEIMQEITRAEVAAWPAHEPFTMQACTQAISLRVILRAGFGFAGDEATRFGERIVDLIAALKPSLMFVKWLRRDFGGLGPWARLRRAMAAVEAQLNEVVSARRSDGSSRDDILSLVLAARYDDGSAMSDRQIFETMMTLIIAGHETTALALAWALWLIHRHPPVKERLEAELATVDAGDAEAAVKLPYLEAVCNETLRLKPIAPSVVRVLRAPATFGGWELPAGTGIAASIIGVQRSEALYPEAEKFRPERFLERSFAPWEFLPFGGGHRRCIGAAFAMFEMKIVLATILRANELRLVDEGDVGATPRSTVIGPARPIRFTQLPA